MSGTYQSFEVPNYLRHPTWFELFLQEASKSVRLVPGCETNPSERVVRKVPAPRLVGVELNPGPRGSRRGLGALRTDSTAAALAGLGGSLASLVSRTKKKKKSSKVARNTLSMPVAQENHRRVVAPVSRGLAIRSSGSRGYCRQRVHSTTMSVGTTAGGIINMVSLATGTATQTFALDVNDPDNILGYGVSVISLGFIRWRICSDLVITYHPTCATTSSGAIALGYMPDSRYADAAAVTSVAGVLGLDNSALFSPWASAVIRVPLKDVDSAWKYRLDATTAGAAEMSLQHAGLLLINSLSTMTASTTFGALSVAFDIEFADLCGVVTSAPAVAAPRRAALNVSGDEEYVTAQLAATQIAPPTSVPASSSAVRAQPPPGSVRSGWLG